MEPGTPTEKVKQLRGNRNLRAPLPLNGEDDGMPPTYSQSKSVKYNPGILRKNRVLTASCNSEYIESYKVLRAHIHYRAREKGWRTIMITSCGPMEGKTLTTINLGITMAMDFNQTVMLVDADLRRQKLHQYLGISVQYGLVDHLINKRPLSDSIVWPGIEKLSIISGSKRYRNSSEILGSSQMKRLIQEMKGRYKDRYILFDTAPVLSGADAIVFAPYVDCILMVVRSGKTKRRELSKALEVIPPEKLIGFVLNDHARAFEGYYYYY